MKNRLMTLGLLLSVLTMLTACLGEDDTETVTYNDTAITAFSLGTLTRTMHTTSSTGEDSTYTASVKGSNYAFSIDQQRGLIYNTDSLPVGTNVKRVLCTISTKNSGTAILNVRTKNGLKDSLVTYSSTDSLDFTNPMELRVYAYSGIAYRKYTITVNVHQQDGDEFCWTKVLDQEPNFAQTERMRMFSAGDKPYLFLKDNGSTVMYDLKQHIMDVQQEYPSTATLSLSASAFDNAVSNGSMLYVLEKEIRKLHCINASTHESQEGCDTTAVDRLIGASSKEIYALSKQGTLLVSTDNCQSWVEESLDNDAELLPEQNISCTVHTLRTNQNMERVELIGSVPGRANAVVWMKVVDRDVPGAGQWMLVSNGTATGNAHMLPASQAQSVLAYDNQDLAFGYNDEGGLGDILLSSDGGINWMTDEAYVWPADAAGQGVIAAAVDNNNYLWMVLGGTGQVWRCRLNRLGWDVK